MAAAAGLPGYEVLQYHYSYLRPRTDLPGPLSPDGEQGVASGDLLSYVRAEPALTLVAYSPLLGGGYVRQDKPLEAEFDHPRTPARLTALREVATYAGATVNQVVLAWIIGADIPVIPLVWRLLGGATGRKPGCGGPRADQGPARPASCSAVTAAIGGPAN